MAATASNFERKAHFTFIWAIENASALLVSEVESPTFMVQSIEKTEWKLEVFDVLQLNSIELSIQNEKDSGTDDIEIEFELSFLAADGSILETKVFEKQFLRMDRNWISLILKHNDVFLQRRAEFLPNDTLTIRCRMWRTDTEILRPDTCFARTRLGMDRRCFIWAIGEFSSLQPGQKRTRVVNPTSLGSPQLILNLFISEMNGKNYLNIQIVQNVATKFHNIFCKFCLLDTDGRVAHSVETEDIISMEEEGLREVYTFREFFEKDKTVIGEASLLLNDVLSLRCDFQIEADPVWSRIENYRYLNLDNLEEIMTEKPEMHLGEPGECFTESCPFKTAFEDLYGDESLTDIILTIGEMSFPAHKNVMSVRSPMFKTMFTHAMRKKRKVVEITDLNADTLNRLLLYIYKDTVEELQWESAIDLFRAADKYQLLDLRKKCSFFLKSNLSLTNVGNILLLADVYEDGDLRKAAKDFISEHGMEIFVSNT
ncbi:Speckle-type POZ protein [Araneus ventricosus]|uniref:Speckle-type POZ protein n=1 Tax=Araneus ventricosus TaxID=182803 RepID=A0A4Y2PBL8_ARAVE|nr:Speckle-type POZ protein [Araneus ventricosus]